MRGWRLLWLMVAAAAVVRAAEVTYDRRSLLIDGERKILFSGSIHYPRSTPQMWPSLISQAKEGGVDVIQTYVFWNLHETQPGQYDFSGRYDLVEFIKEIQAQGLYACLRIGPFVEAEWAYGGFPFWLHDVPGITFRTDNEPFKFYMQNFTAKIVSLMKSEGLYASQGGPIILSQIENEYQNIEAAFQEQGSSYVRWAASMAVGLETGVPWVMCKQNDAPDPVINTCNGMRCGETFAGPNSPNKPSLWTENWTSFYQVFGKGPYLRSAEDIAFHVALFIAKMNGSYINYYMYHGGTNFGRTASAYIITSYYDQAPLDEYGLKRQPKWGQLRDLHFAVKNCSVPLLHGAKSNLFLGPLQQAYVFEEENGGCVSFLVNNDSRSATVEFRNLTVELPLKSISILQNCNNVIFNTATVNFKGNTRATMITWKFDDEDKWQEYVDPTPNFSDTSLMSNSLLEQMNTTKDISDYLWYTLEFQPNSSCTRPVLHVESQGHAAHVFVNGVNIGFAHGNHDVKGFILEYLIPLINDMNNISILSNMVGLPDSGPFMERKVAGLIEVEIQCDHNELYNLTEHLWGYQVSLVGEKLQIYEEKNSHKVLWSSKSSQNQPLTWYKVEY
ncbi:hypothetical protein SAY86_002939 [Trapa natans]|uniref:Beta-galactosidase n=1 Tax=Trapa natans TaxID=22666 RepID=A0AAN7LRT0_TRANT|nr:hypothetical protein SAY86_002939 [Trapa natans]